MFVCVRFIVLVRTDLIWPGEVLITLGIEGSRSRRSSACLDLRAISGRQDESLEESRAYALAIM